ncbi:MAG: methylenetetrahydrofolate reductase [NAD(P)H] [Holosporaceae bacterium]|jgi:methylenetetrahydrofolate reductase (NADPH)|nr:methylenetetrahydrofolate reductase [NAD(P)H] [Holosporaceae bacterium]
MYLSDLFQRKKCLFSFEIFPPKKDSAEGEIHKIIAHLAQLHPDFISVTCGAGGSAANDNITVKTAGYIKKEHGIESLAHMTCVNSSRRSLEETLDLLKENHLENVLALRGDRLKDSYAGDFAYVQELICLIKRKGGFHIAAACYPEGHPESGDSAEDVRHLKEKVDAGASHLISQLFYDNGDFYRFMDKVRAVGVDVPVEAGIMPAVDKHRIEKIVTLCGATLPTKLSRMLSCFEKSPAALFDAGIAYATEQIIDLISSGVQGIHLYTMNNPAVAEKITHNVENLLREVNGERF